MDEPHLQPAHHVRALERPGQWVLCVLHPRATLPQDLVWSSLRPGLEAAQQELSCCVSLHARMTVGTGPGAGTSMCSLSVDDWPMPTKFTLTESLLLGCEGRLNAAAHPLPCSEATFVYWTVQGCVWSLISTCQSLSRIKWCMCPTFPLCSSAIMR